MSNDRRPHEEFDSIAVVFDQTNEVILDITTNREAGQKVIDGSELSNLELYGPYELRDKSRVEEVY